MAIGTGHTTKWLAAGMWREWRKQPSYCVVGTNIRAGYFKKKKYLCGWTTVKKCNPAWVLQSARAGEQTGWPCVASHMSTRMTHWLLSKFNSLDASPSNVPILLGEGASEIGEKNKLRWYVIMLNGCSLPHPFIVPTPSEIMKWKASFFFFSICHKSCKSSHSYLWCRKKLFTAWLLESAKSQSINNSKHPTMWVVNSIW